MESMPEKLLYFIWGPGTPLLNTIGCIGGSWAKSKLEKFGHLLEGITGLTAARTFWKKKKVFLTVYTLMSRLFTMTALYWEISPCRYGRWLKSATPDNRALKCLLKKGFFFKMCFSKKDFWGNWVHTCLL